MKKNYILLFVFIILWVNLAAQVVKTDKGIILKTVNGNVHTLQIEVLTDNIIHLAASPTDVFSNRNNEVVSKISGKAMFSVVIGNEKITIRTTTLNVIVDQKNGKVIFMNKQNKQLLEENNRVYKPFKNFAESSWTVQQEFKWSMDEVLYGLDKNINRSQSLRGCKFELFSEKADNNFPLIVSSKGYGVLWDNKSYTCFTDVDTASYIWSEDADQIDYYFLYGPSQDEVVVNYIKLTGKVELMPKLAQGVISPDESNGLKSGTGILK